MHGDRSSFGESHSLSRWVAHKLRRLGPVIESLCFNMADKIDGTQASRSGGEGRRSGTGDEIWNGYHHRSRNIDASHDSTQRNSQEKGPNRPVKERSGHRRPPSSREALSAWDSMYGSGVNTNPAPPPLDGLDSTTARSIAKDPAPQQANKTIVDPDQSAGGTTIGKRRTVHFDELPEETAVERTRGEVRKLPQTFVCPIIHATRLSR